MNNLHRELAPISDAAWEQIEEETTRTLKRYLAGRRVVDVPASGGVGLPAVATGHLLSIASPAEDIIARQREVKALVELRVPFVLTRQAIDDVERGSDDSDWQPAKDAARKIAFAIASPLSVELHGRGARGELVALVVLGPDLEVGEQLPVLGADGGDDAAGGHGHALGVGRAELALEAADRAVVAQPVADQVVQVGPLQVAHAERGRVTRLAPGLVVHVDRDELVVDRRVAVPVGKTGLPGERRKLVSDLGQSGSSHLVRPILLAAAACC